MAELSYCAAQVRRMDPDRFATALFAPDGRREALMALYAFNTEVARVRETVSEPLVGEIRLQWWRDALDGIAAGTPRRHGVVEPLADAIAEFGLPRAAFDELIDARGRDLDDEPPETLEELVGYADATSGALQALALRIVAPDAASGGAGGGDAETAARHVGIAFALAGIARAVPFHASLGKVHLPRQVCREAGLPSAAHDRLKPGAEVSKAAEILCRRATEHLEKARRLRPQVDKAALPALLPAVVVDRHLRRMAASGHDPFDARNARPAAAHLRLAWAAFRGRY